MEDREFLMWIHERLEHVHNEEPLMDYMHKLRAIIANTPKGEVTPNCNSKNSLNALREHLEKEEDVKSAFTPLNPLIAEAIERGEDTTGLCTVKELTEYLISEHTCTNRKMERELFFSLPDGRKVNIELRVTRVTS